MIFLSLVLVVTAAYVEIKVVNAFPRFGDWLSKYRPACLAFSMLLSVGLAAMFGAEGLIVMVAGLGSTMIMQPYYAMRKSGALDDFRRKQAEMWENYERNKALYLKRAKQCWAILVFWWKVLTFPIRAFFAVLDFLDWAFNRQGKEVQ